MKKIFPFAPDPPERLPTVEELLERIRRNEERAPSRIEHISEAFRKALRDHEDWP
jgi:hypothetical protein